MSDEPRHRRIGRRWMPPALATIGALCIGAAIPFLPISSDAGGERGLPGRWDNSCFGRSITIYGTRGPDAITGSDGPDVIFAYTGDDRIFSSKGNDRICGRWGDDFINAGKGFDRVDGSHGSDLCLLAEKTRKC